MEGRVTLNAYYIQTRPIGGGFYEYGTSWSQGSCHTNNREARENVYCRDSVTGFRIMRDEHGA
jgi:hypothetical protein